MSLKTPDRVPVVEFVIDEKVAREAVPGCVDSAECMDRLDMDGVGCGAQFEIVTRYPDGRYIDEWGVLYKTGPEVVAHPIEGPIKTIQDIDAYAPPDPDSEFRLTKLRTMVQRYKGKRSIVFHHRAAFMWSAYLMGMENILMNFLLDPPFVEAVMDKVLDANMSVVRNAIRAGAEVIVLGDDYAHNSGPMMSPSVFERFIVPRLIKMIDLIHDEGAFCIKHSDGNLYPILEMIVSAGPDGLNPIEPVAGMDLKTVKKLVGDKVCLIGNIDCGRLLSHGTVAEVRKAVREAMNAAKDGGGYIVSSSNSIHSSCKAENLIAMVEATHEFGAYE